MAGNVVVELNNKHVWLAKYPNMEMTHSAIGTRLQPPLHFNISGLHEEKLYYVFLSLVRADDSRYLFSKKDQNWEKAHCSPHKIVNDKPILYSECFQLGTYLNKNVIKFDNVKISHDEKSVDVIHVHTSHKYIPLVHIIESTSSDPALFFPITIASFITVRTYRAEGMRDWKRHRNWKMDRHDSSSGTYVHGGTEKRVQIAEPNGKSIPVQQGILIPAITQLSVPSDDSTATPLTPIRVVKTSDREKDEENDERSLPKPPTSIHESSFKNEPTRIIQLHNDDEDFKDQDNTEDMPEIANESSE